jgi:hypothetical protein
MLTAPGSTFGGILKRKDKENQQNIHHAQFSVVRTSTLLIPEFSRPRN